MNGVKGNCSGGRPKLRRTILALMISTASSGVAQAQDGADTTCDATTLPYGYLVRGDRIPITSSGLKILRSGGFFESYTNGVSGLGYDNRGGDGGNGANGGFDGHGHDGDAGGNGQNILGINCGQVTTNDTGVHGVRIVSRGGNGGSGGNGGVVDERVGHAAPGGNGGDIQIRATNRSDILTRGDGANAIHAYSKGGTGGQGGNGSGFTGGTDGAPGGNGGSITMTIARKGEQASIETLGKDAHGVKARSEGGDAGTGGNGAVLFGGGPGEGGSSGNGGRDIAVDSAAWIKTHGGGSSGMLLESIGGQGGDGGSQISLVAALGASGGIGGRGGKIDVTNAGAIWTLGHDAIGLKTQSIGGGGGSGGDAFNISAFGGAAIGGSGGGGGGGEAITINNASDIFTQGRGSNAVLANSIGGGGGDGGRAIGVTAGFGVAVQMSVGGAGGNGGNGAAVSFHQKAGDLGTVIQTGWVPIDAARTPVDGVDAMPGDQADAIVTQSIGGGGGNGGRSIAVAAAGSDTPAFSAAIAVGGSGGNGGDGAAVNTTLDARTSVLTVGRHSNGVVSQSLGGGGGSGGSVITIAAAVGTSAGAVSVGIGGSGGSGGDGGKVFVDSSADVSTLSTLSTGISARSAGGGGGHGGNVIDVAAGLAKQSLTIGVAIGGTGGGGGTGNDVDLYSHGVVQTAGDKSHGLLSQSVGGGGGSGGNVHTYAVSASLGGGSNGIAAAANVSIGGTGGTGNTSGRTTIWQTGSVTTYGDASNGAFVQSIGGGGGEGGNAFGLSVAASLDKGGLEGTKGGRNLSATVAIGGKGGHGGVAGEARYDGYSNATVTTSGVRSSGIVVQSIGGGGGSGGNARSFSASSAVPVDLARVKADKDGLLDKIGKGPTDKGPEADTKNGLTASVAVGGNGGTGNKGGLVKANIDTNMRIHTLGTQSYGVFAQSIGGGGGAGGDATSDGFMGVDSYAINIGIGGVGGTGGHGGDVYVATQNHSRDGGLLTEASGAYGILAQSVGGGGGEAGSAVSKLESLPRLTKQTVSVVIGGRGGASGDGGAVDVRYDQSITTRGDMASAMVAQSIGGGGGTGGTSAGSGKLEFTVGGAGGASGKGGLVLVMGDSSLMTSGTASHGLVAQSVGGGGGIGSDAGGTGSKTDYGLKVHLGGDGSNGGNGGRVMVTRDGYVSTSGSSSFGILAQSVGGGGGLTAASNITVLATNQPSNLDYVSGSGNGGEVSVSNGRGSLTISTSGDSAHGVFAQSVGGGGGVAVVPGDVRYEVVTPFTKSASSGGNVYVYGIDDISTNGDNAYGIYAESVSSGMTVISGTAGTSHVNMGDDGNGIVDVAQTGSLMTFGQSSHGIYARNSNVVSNRAVKVSVEGFLMASGRDSWGIIAVNGENRNSSNVSRTMVVDVLQGGTIRTGERSAGAINLQNHLGSTDLTIAGNVIAERGIAVQSYGAVNMTVSSTGRVVGSILPGKGAFDILNAGTITGWIGTTQYAAGTYTLAEGGRHDLRIDPRGMAGGTDVVIATHFVSRGGRIVPRLTSIPNGPYRVDGILTGAFDGPVSDLIAGGGLGTVYDFVKRDGSIDLTGVRIDFTQAGLEGNDASLAQIATNLVGPWTQSVVTGDQQDLNAFLLAAANETSKEALSAVLRNFDTSTHFSSVDASMLSTTNHLNGMQSCGTARGPNAAIAESECSWAKVTYGEVERRGGDQKHVATTYAFGQQREVSPNVFVGLNAAYEESQFRSTNARAQGRRIHVGAIAKLSRGPVLASASAVLSHGWGDGVRDVPLNGTRARSDHRTSGVATRLRAMYLHEIGILDLFPLVELDMAVIDDAGYEERGGGAFGMKVHGKTHFVADLRPAIRVGSAADVRSSVLRAYAETGVRFALNDTSHLTSLANSPIAHAPGAISHGRDAVVGTLATGASLNTSGRLEVSVRYEAGYGRDTLSHIASLKAGLRF